MKENEIVIGDEVTYKCLANDKTYRGIVTNIDESTNTTYTIFLEDGKSLIVFNHQLNKTGRNFQVTIELLLQGMSR